MEIDTSVCIPTYNRASMLREAIESVLPQLSLHDELLILDNHSSDETQIVLAQFDTPRLRIARNPATVTMYANHNRCFDEARGRWVLILHSDDKLAPGALATLKRYSALEPRVASIHPINSDSGGTIRQCAPMILSGATGSVALFRWLLGSPSGTLYSRDWLLRTPFPACNVEGGMLLFSRLLAQQGSILLIPEFTVTIGQGRFQTTNRWVSSGQFIEDVAESFHEMVRVPGILPAIVAAVPEWSDDEVSRCLMLLAHAREGSAIRLIETALAHREGYRKTAHYRHVRVYHSLGWPGLRLIFGLAKRLRRVLSRGLR